MNHVLLNKEVGIMNYNSRDQEKVDRNFSKIYALYKKGYSIDYIVSSMPHMARFQVINVIQTIFGQEQVNKEKARAHF